MPESFKDTEKQADSFLDTLKCRVQKPYPSSKIPYQNVKAAEMLLSAFGGGGNSELSALTQYFVHSQTIKNEEVSGLLLCVSMDEMRHLQLVGEMITSLGGELKYWSADHAFWTGGYVNYGTTDDEKLSFDIFSEQEAIAGYESLLRDINAQRNNMLAPIEALIRRILEDEAYHLTLFTETYNSLYGK